MAAKYGTKHFREQLSFFKDKLNLPTRSWTDLWEGMHARAFVVAGAMKDELLVDLNNAVRKAIEKGTTLAEFRQDFDAIVQKHGWGYKGGRNWRTRVIYETNLRTSYQAGRYKQMKALVHRRPYWQYKHSNFVKDPRKAHLEWDGLILKYDDDWWDTHYPPNGWGCRCTVRTLAERDMKKLGRQGPDKAPPIEWEAHEVGKRGPNPRRVRVPKGIDPGWGYNVGEAAWGRATTRKLADNYVGGKWERLTPGNWRSYGLPESLPAIPSTIKVSSGVSTTEEMAERIKTVIGGETRIYKIAAGSMALALHVDAEILAKHVKLDRAPFIPFLADMIETPQEIWLTFERHKETGYVALRMRIIKIVQTEKNRPLLLVANAQGGRLLAWTFMPYKMKRANSLREGILLYANEDEKK